MWVQVNFCQLNKNWSHQSRHCFHQTGLWGCLQGHLLDGWLMCEGPSPCELCQPGGPGWYKNADWPCHGEQAGQQHSLGSQLQLLPPDLCPGFPCWWKLQSINKPLFSPHCFWLVCCHSNREANQDNVAGSPLGCRVLQGHAQES